MTRKKFIFKTIVKGAILLLLIAILPDLMTAIAPLISNEIALGQMESHNDMYILMQTYEKYLSLARGGFGIILALIVASIGRDTYKFIKTIKNSANNVNGTNEKEN